MKAWLVRWLIRMETLIVNRRDSTSVLVLVEWTLPFLLLLLAMQWYAASDAALRRLYQARWLWPSLWAQALLILWLSAMGVVAWRMRGEKRALSWLVQLTVLPAGWGILLLSVGHGHKDSHGGGASGHAPCTCVPRCPCRGGSSFWQAPCIATGSCSKARCAPTC